MDVAVMFYSSDLKDLVHITHFGLARL